MASSSPTSGIASSDNVHRNSLRHTTVIAFLLVSGLYFADTILRATLKTFWYDELVTVYLCRLPSFHATWFAVLHGGDLNPPLFYLLTRWAQHFSGEGLIASRMPAIVGFWIFGISLYLFTARRLGRFAGCIAALAPWLTLAHYYAYEARPHGPLLGWLGLMLVCWQRSRDSTSARRWLPQLWLLGLSFSYLAALLTHVYAVYLAAPFLLVELDHLVRHRRLRIGPCLAILVPVPIVAPLYLKLTRRYVSGVIGGGLHIHPYEAVAHSLTAIYAPGLVIVLVLLALLASQRHRDAAHPSMSRGELVLAMGFILLPVLGVIGVKITHGPYFDRYFLASTAGYAILLAQVVALAGKHTLVPRAMAGVLLFLLTADVLIAAYAHWHHADLDQVEPSSHIAFPPDPAHPFMRNAALLDDHSQLDILVTGHPDYSFFEYYASPQLRSRLIFAAPQPDEMFLDSYQHLSQLTGIGLRTTTLDNYFQTHRDFLLYASERDDCRECMEKILTAGYSLRSVQPDIDGQLEHFSK